MTEPPQDAPPAHAERPDRASWLHWPATGFSLGLAVGKLLPSVSQMPVVISWEPLALGVAAALVVGTFFGVQPARRAARLHPVEALR